jgi:hypothetical protein
MDSFALKSTQTRPAQPSLMMLDFLLMIEPRHFLALLVTIVKLRLNTAPVYQESTVQTPCPLLTKCSSVSLRLTAPRGSIAKIPKLLKIAHSEHTVVRVSPARLPNHVLSNTTARILKQKVFVLVQNIAP